MVRPSVIGTVLASLAAGARGAAHWPAHPHAPPAHAYVHVPFCRRRCYYCDFPITVVGARPQAAHEAVRRYMGPLCREIRAAATLERQPGAPPLQTVYIGGGTPSLAPAEEIGALLREVRDAFGVAEGAEVTLELDPGTFDDESLAAYLACGVNRASIGVQSFDGARLEAAGRAHSVDDGARAIALLQRAREGGTLRSWSLDLIGGLPGETLVEWRASLLAAVAACPDHISVYDLSVEPRTAYGRWEEAGKLKGLPSEEASADMYREAAAVLTEVGYEHYEVSSYARPGHRSRHNCAYWRNTPFLAFGTGAASYTRALRFSRPRSIAAYAEWVSEFERHGVAAQRKGGESVGPRDWLLETVMVGLRRSDGIDLDQLAAVFGDAAARACLLALEPAERRGLVSRSQVAGSAASDVGGGEQGQRLGCVRLSSPEGFLLSNDIIADVFVKLNTCVLPLITALPDSSDEVAPVLMG
ncbi:hypothetical protein T492DRAFT_604216 [Pavlovales sp. CCMP2436]|nr:hypothetical protein T492DRAFT_604216 [Pavlovales sp. CCMP2436]|mmetsp:Transcript_5019/g.13313  ORF Transcript_5019/g.13313 Transcript_5019/m.13313 type:complete len:472 (+) Transcript_5019:165-1580(+)